MGISWKDFRKMNYIRGEVKYYKYKQGGFSTPTRKFELYSTVLEKMGYDPLPQHREPPESPVSTPDLLIEYPYILITGARQPGFFHTENRQVRRLRELHKDPIVEVHPDAAAMEGIKEGDWVVIESRRGKIRQRARLSLGCDPRIVAAEHGGGGQVLQYNISGSSHKKCDNARPDPFPCGLSALFSVSVGNQISMEACLHIIRHGLRCVGENKESN